MTKHFGDPFNRWEKALVAVAIFWSFTCVVFGFITDSLWSLVTGTVLALLVTTIMHFERRARV